MTSRNIIRFVSITCLCLVTAALIIAWGSPATGCEPSIYSATPTIVWVFFIFSIVGGFSIIVQQVHTKEFESNNSWIVGLLLVMLPWVSILLLPTIRGYLLFGNGDCLTHLGFASVIQSTGHNSELNFYPAMHIFVAGLSQVLDVEPLILFRYIPALFNILYVMFMYFLARCILPNKGQVILATAAATIIGFPSAHMVPWNLASLTLPLALFLFVKSCQLRQTQPQFKILFVIMLILFPVFHIMPALTLGLVVLTLWLPSKIHIAATTQCRNIHWNYKFITVACLFLVAWSFGWISQFWIWGQTASTFALLGSGIATPIPAVSQPVQEQLLTQGYSHLQILIAQIAYGRSVGYSVAAQFFKVYGIAAVYIALALVAFPLLIKRGRVDTQLGNLFCWYGPLAAHALTLIALYMTNIPAWPNRLVSPMMMMSTLFLGFICYKLLSFTKHRFLAKVIILVVPLALILGLSGSILRLYPSSYNLTMYERQLTRTEATGMHWFLDKKDTSLGSVQITAAPFRYVHFFFGPDEMMQREDIQGWYGYDQPPPHFGYQNKATLGESYAEDKYMELVELDRQLHEKIFTKSAKFTFYASDFDKLAHDPSLDKLYSNGEFDVWFIRASGEADDL